jgi:hypothetical protein
MPKYAHSHLNDDKIRVNLTINALKSGPRFLLIKTKKNIQLFVNLLWTYFEC